MRLVRRQGQLGTQAVNTRDGHRRAPRARAVALRGEAAHGRVEGAARVRDLTALDGHEAELLLGERHAAVVVERDALLEVGA